MNVILKKWNLPDTDLKKFIMKFYFGYLGSLYMVIYSLALAIVFFRKPNLDWYFQGDLTVIIKITMALLLLGLLSCVFGTFKLLRICRQTNQKHRVVIAVISLAVPAFMYLVAIASAQFIVPLINAHRFYS